MIRGTESMSMKKGTVLSARNRAGRTVPVIKDQMMLYSGAAAMMRRFS